MKNGISKIFCLITAVCVILCTAAAGGFSSSALGASLSGNKTVRAGDTLSITLNISGPEVYGCQASFSYDSSVLTYKSYKKRIGWGEVAFNYPNLVARDTSESKPISKSAAVITLNFKVANNLPVGTPISVSANVTVSQKADGAFSSSSYSCSYSASVATPLSSNALLSGLAVSNAELTPAFSPDVQKYTCQVPFETESLDIKATAQDAKSKVSIENNALTAGADTDVLVKVTSESGAVNTYTITAARAQDPNYVPSSDNNLLSLTVEQYFISPAFSPNVTDYIVWLPFETSSINVFAEAAPEASVEISDNTASLEVGNNLITVTVTAEDETQKKYNLVAVRAEQFTSAEEFLNPAADADTDKSGMDRNTALKYAAVCFACLLVGFVCSFMIPRGKKAKSKEDSPTDEYEEQGADYPEDTGMYDTYDAQSGEESENADNITEQDNDFDIDSILQNINSEDKD